MQPVAAALLTFALVFGALFWLCLLYTSFKRAIPLGLLALFAPPLALILLYPLRKQERDLFVLALAAMIFFTISGVINRLVY
ncbi:MAG: hypothetical protein K0U59_03690 [Gammaproteobacteria bacterium]|nr:hypothetical protein [Gammaproteobacteria bacterium]